MDNAVVDAADREAADQIDSHAQWADVHRKWEMRTQRQLSPASFGRRILTVRENRIKAASPHSTPSEQRHPSAPDHHKGPPSHADQHPHGAPSQSQPPQPPMHHAPPPQHAHSGQAPSQMRPSPLIHHHAPPPQAHPHHPPSTQPPAPGYAATPPTHAAHPHHHAPPLQPAPPITHGRGPVGGPVPVDAHEQQRAELQRVDNAIHSLRHEMDVVRRNMDELRADMHKRAQGGRDGPGGDIDAGTLETLAQSLSNVSSKAHEVDGLKFVIESLKKRVQALENAPPGAPTQPLAAAVLKREPSHGTFATHHQSPAMAPSHHPSPAMAPSHHQSPAMPQPSHTSPHVATAKAPQSSHASPAAAPSAPPAEVTSSGWAAVNSSKRKASLEGTDDPTKRTRLHTDLSHEGGYAPASAEHVHTPTYGQPRSVSGQESYSHETSWQAKQYAPPGSAGRGAYSGGRGRGRPRKPTPEYGTPASWDGNSESWTSQEDAVRYGAHIAAYESPSRSAERAAAMQRGGLLGSEQPTAMRRTRQKPTRNADGILIRKDGKPDQRSISSAMNLKKVHARKMAELEMSSQGGGSPASTMDHSPTNGHGDYGSPALAKHSGDESTNGDDKEASVEHENGAKDSHRQVLQKIFPRGADETAERFNHASHIFNTNGPAHPPLQPRQDMAKKSRPASKSIDETPVEQAKVLEEPASNGVKPLPLTEKLEPQAVST